MARIKNISVRLVNKELKELNKKKHELVDSQRNSIGFQIARKIWTKIMLTLTDQKNALLICISSSFGNWNNEKQQSNYNLGCNYTWIWLNFQMV